MRRAFRVLFACVVLTAAWTGSALLAGPAEDLKAVGKFLPSGTKGLLYFKSPGDIKGLFRGTVFVASDRVEKHLQETCSQFATATGFHPVKDSDWFLMNLVMGEGGKPENPMVFVHGKFDLDKLLPALEKDAAMTSGEVTKETVAGRPIYVNRSGAAGAFATDRLLLVGDAPSVRAALESAAKPGKPGFDVAAAIKTLDLASHKIFVALDLTDVVSRLPAAGQNPTAAAILAKMVKVYIQFSDSKFNLALEFREPPDAKAATDMLNGLKDFAKSYFAMTASQRAAATASSALARISPDNVYGAILSEAASEFLAATTLSAAERVMTLQAPREKIAFLDSGDGPIVMLLGGAAVALPNFLRGREIASRASCYQNQRGIQNGLDIWRQQHPNDKNPKIDVVVDQMVQDGQLPGRPDDPGQGRGSFANYVIGPDGKVTCQHHGAVSEAAEGGLFPEGAGLQAPPPPPAPEPPQPAAAPTPPGTGAAAPLPPPREQPSPATQPEAQPLPPSVIAPAGPETPLPPPPGAPPAAAPAGPQTPLPPPPGATPETNPAAPVPPAPASAPAPAPAPAAPPSPTDTAP